VDSDKDGVSDNDHDFSCNQLYMQKYTPSYDSIIGRIYYADASLKLVSKDFNVSFLDFEVKLDPKMKEIYDNVVSLLGSME
jgi:protein involved in sex pheromone biosynthesis